MRKLMALIKIVARRFTRLATFTLVTTLTILHMASQISILHDASH